MTNIEASNILPYHIDDIRKGDRGIDVVEVEGAVIAHVACVDDIMSELKYPCRIEAFVAVLCVRGEVSFSSHLSDYRLTENQLFVASSTTMQFKSSRNAELYIVAFTSDFINDMNLDKRLLLPIFMSLHRNSRVMDVPTTAIERVRPIFCRFYDEYPQLASTPFGRGALRHLVCSIIYRLCIGLSEGAATVEVSSVKDRSIEYFEKLMRLLSENYRTERNVEFYADRLHISAKHLSRVIRNYTGKSVHQWIDEFVALEIKNLLRYSSLSIQQISYQLNFPNPSFMGQYFKRITGMTPGQYRRL